MPRPGRWRAWRSPLTRSSAVSFRCWSWIFTIGVSSVVPPVSMALLKSPFASTDQKAASPETLTPPSSSRSFSGRPSAKFQSVRPSSMATLAQTAARASDSLPWIPTNSADLMKGLPAYGSITAVKTFPSFGESNSAPRQVKCVAQAVCVVTDSARSTREPVALSRRRRRNLVGAREIGSSAP